MDDNQDGDERGGRRRPARPPRVYAPREPRPIDAAQLQEMALGYAARYATTAAKLRQYLARKLRERTWTPAEPPDIEGLSARIVALGYVNDRAYAASKTRDLTARGFGQQRVRSALSAAGVSRDDVAAEAVEASPFVAALAFARRRRLGPFGRDGSPADPAVKRRQMAAMARAGHGFDVARRVIEARNEAAAEALVEGD